MEKILQIVGGSQGSVRKDDDFSDKLNHRYTVSLMVMFAVIVSSKQYVGNPIDCWLPTYFGYTWHKYVHSYCWIKNTYYLPFEEHIPHEHEENKRDMITYYQWIPIILLVQGLLFYLPIVVWRTFNGRSGIDVNNIVGLCQKFYDKPDEDFLMENISKQIDRYLSSLCKKDKCCKCSVTHCISTMFRVGRRYGNYLSVFYLLTKIIFIINVIGQLFLLDILLGTNFHFYGIQAIISIAQGEWMGSTPFPRVTMCDFNVRVLGNVQRYTVQCVLPINLFNEAIYLFLWFWMVFTAAASCFSLVIWIRRLTLRGNRRRYIKDHLAYNDKIKTEMEKEIAITFVEKYLRVDGVFLFFLISLNTDTVTTTEILCKVFENYMLKPLFEVISEQELEENDHEIEDDEYFDDSSFDSIE